MKLISESSLASAFAVIAVLISNGVILPLQQATLPDAPFHSAVICLTHGVAVICAWLVGWRSVALLMPGVLFAHFVLSGPTALMPYPVAIQLFHVASAPLAFSLFAWAGVDAREDRRWNRNWRLILLIGGVSSVIHSVGGHAINFRKIPVEHHLFGIMHEIGADVAGLAIVMTLVMLLFRFIRLAPGAGYGGER